MAEEDKLTPTDANKCSARMNQVTLYKNQEKLMKKLFHIQKMIKELPEKCNDPSENLPFAR